VGQFQQGFFYAQNLGFLSFIRTMSSLFLIILAQTISLINMHVILFLMPRLSDKQPKPLDIEIEPFGPRLAKIRKLRGFSQYSLADELGVTRKRISDYERGLAHPNEEMIIHLAIALKVSADALLGLKEIDLPESPSVRFTRRLKDLESLPEAKKRAVVKILDEFIKS
jgi:transcriptional regulator with XRE-family HTH domain